MAGVKGRGNFKHGQESSTTYVSWRAMTDRCLNKNATKYPSYGGRGITICERWRDFRSFFADMGERPLGKTLDRIDNSKGYSPDNCRWATPKEQRRNNRRIRLITYDGMTMCLQDWANQLNLPYLMLFKRLKRGWSIEKTFTDFR